MGQGVLVYAARGLGAVPGAERAWRVGVHCRRHRAPVGQGTCPRWTFSFAPQIEDETQVSRATQGEQDNYEMHVRAANIVSRQVEGTVWAPEACGPYCGSRGVEGQTASQETPFQGRAFLSS